MADKIKEVILQSKQAEVFDLQMTTDRVAFEATDECVIFRPEIKGEWSTYESIGEEPPSVAPSDLKGYETIQAELDWVCVVDIGRATMRTRQSSGMRMRVRCFAPHSQEVAEQIAAVALGIAGLAQRAFSPRRRVKRLKPRGFG